jgi:hypothetical protein
MFSSRQACDDVCVHSHTADGVSSYTQSTARLVPSRLALHATCSVNMALIVVCSCLTLRRFSKVSEHVSSDTYKRPGLVRPQCSIIATADVIPPW